MANKKLKRMFLMHCCQLIKAFTIDDFSHNGNMTLVCHKHVEPVVRYITWRSGLDKEDYDKVVEQYKKDKIEGEKK
jgi:hypothetical protein